MKEGKKKESLQYHTLATTTNAAPAPAPAAQPQPTHTDAIPLLETIHILLTQSYGGDRRSGGKKVRFFAHFHF
jgi:hypothetical protein